MSFRGRLYLIDFDGFILKLFVVQEEATQHHQSMRWQVAGLEITVKLRILRRHRNVWSFFPVSIIVIKPNGARMNEGERHHCLLA